jgi:hypothetical protein
LAYIYIPQGDVESIEGAEKNDKLYPGGGIKETSVSH